MFKSKNNSLKITNRPPKPLIAKELENIKISHVESEHYLESTNFSLSPSPTSPLPITPTLPDPPNSLYTIDETETSEVEKRYGYSHAAKIAETEHRCIYCLSSTAKKLVYLDCGHFVHIDCMTHELLDAIDNGTTITSELINNQVCPSCLKIIPTEDIQCALRKYYKKSKEDLKTSKEVIDQTESTIKELGKNIQIQMEYSQRLDNDNEHIQHMLLCVKD